MIGDFEAKPFVVSFVATTADRLEAEDLDVRR